MKPPQAPTKDTYPAGPPRGSRGGWGRRSSTTPGTRQGPGRGGSRLLAGLWPRSAHALLPSDRCRGDPPRPPTAASQRTRAAPHRGRRAPWALGTPSQHTEPRLHLLCSRHGQGVGVPPVGTARAPGPARRKARLPHHPNTPAPESPLCQDTRQSPPAVIWPWPRHWLWLTQCKLAGRQPKPGGHPPLHLQGGNAFRLLNPGQTGAARPARRPQARSAAAAHSWSVRDTASQPQWLCDTGPSPRTPVRSKATSDCDSESRSAVWGGVRGTRATALPPEGSPGVSLMAS